MGCIPCSTLKYAPLEPRPLIRIPLGKGSFLPLSSRDIKSCKIRQTNGWACTKDKIINKVKDKIILGEINYRVVELVPISNEDSVITGRIIERDWNSRSAQNPNASKTTSSFVKCKRWEVVEASNLILHLKNVCEVPSWWDGACCS